MIAAAATAGVIIGFGVRHADWAGPFESLGVQVLQGLGVSNATVALATMTGFTAHAAWMIVWGIAFVVLSHRKPSMVALVLALLVGVLASLAARTAIPAAMGAMRFAALPGIQATLCVAMMIAGLMVGRSLTHAD